MAKESMAWLSLGSLLLLVACGGRVTVDGSSGTSASHGSGGAAGSTTSSGTGFGGSHGACETLGHAACVAAFADCVPIYDDLCCPSCDPGPCADCINYQFHHCAPYAKGCALNGPSCGRVLKEHCAGQVPSCGPVLGSPGPCGQSPGCTLADCPVNIDCDPPPGCVPVTGGACTASCKSPPPACSPTMVPEANGNCWTGLCIMADVCAMP